MNSWKMRGVAALAVLSLAIAGCQNQGGGNDASIDTAPSVDVTAPSTDASMGTDASMDMDMSPSASPSGS
jgi:hypothetical protein